MTAPAYILSDTTLSLFYDGTLVTAHNTHPRWADILVALNEGRYDDITELARPLVAITRFLDGDPDFTIDDTAVKFKGDPVHPLITDRLLTHMKLGLNTKPLANFTRNLANNPDYWVADQLYPFVEKGNLPITPDGYFLAYKLVNDNYTDVYSGTIDYSLGNVVHMPRQKVDNNRERTCSSGLHACSLDYLQHFSGARLVAVKINPADVVSVPSDYNDTKLRCCQMEVVAELDRNLAAPAWTTPVFDYRSDEDPDEFYLTTFDPLTNNSLSWDADDDCWSTDSCSSFYGRDSADTTAHDLARRFNIAVNVEDEFGNIIYTVKAPYRNS